MSVNEARGRIAGLGAASAQGGVQEVMHGHVHGPADAHGHAHDHTHDHADVSVGAHREALRRPVAGGAAPAGAAAEGTGASLSLFRLSMGARLGLVMLVIGAMWVIVLMALR